jgi:hypothetical protein
MVAIGQSWAFRHLPTMSDGEHRSRDALERLRALNEALLNDIGASAAQRCFHREMTRAVIQKVFQDNFEKHWATVNAYRSRL